MIANTVENELNRVEDNAAGDNAGAVDTEFEDIIECYDGGGHCGRSRSKGKQRLGQHACCICEDRDDNVLFILHHTRRQSHEICDECLCAYLKDKIRIMILETVFHRFDRSTTFACPGTYRGHLRNKCTKAINILSIYRQARVMKTRNVLDLCYALAYRVLLPNKYRCCPTCLELCISPFYYYTHYYDDHRYIVCPYKSCHASWCDICGTTPFHDGMSCMEYEIFNSNSSNGKYIAQQIHEGKCRLCGNCKSPIMKDGGCNKITCRCGVRNCFLCGEINVDYSHFNSMGTNPCANRLWV